MANYKPHLNATPPKRLQTDRHNTNPNLNSNSALFNGATTTKTDYVAFALPPHYVRPVQPYTKSAAKLEGISTQAEDYKKWDGIQVPSRRKTAQASPSEKEDRYINFNIVISNPLPMLPMLVIPLVVNLLVHRSH